MCSGQGKSFSRLMNAPALIATFTSAWRQHDSIAARPAVKFRPTGTLSARATARLATTAPLLAGKTIATRRS